MAFVKMSNLLGKTIEVPRGAVKAYQNLGFAVDEPKRVAKVAKVKEEATVETDDSLTEDETFVAGVEKKPVSQWSKEEVKRYATICGVDISGTKNAQEAKERIKAFIDSKVE